MYYFADSPCPSDVVCIHSYLLIVLQACKQLANELAGLCNKLHHLQHWVGGATDEEVLLWMRTQHQGRVLPPLDAVSITLTLTYLHVFLTKVHFTDFTSPPLFAKSIPFAGAGSCEGGAQVSRSPLHIRARAKSRERRGGGPW